MNLQVVKIIGFVGFMVQVFCTNMHTNLTQARSNSTQESPTTITHITANP